MVPDCTQRLISVHSGYSLCYELNTYTSYFRLSDPLFFPFWWSGATVGLCLNTYFTFTHTLQIRNKMYYSWFFSVKVGWYINRELITNKTKLTMLYLPKGKIKTGLGKGWSDFSLNEPSHRMNLEHQFLTCLIKP